MKKLVLLFFTVSALSGHSIGQSYDDGLISSHLSVNTDDARFTAFVNGFRAGMSRVRSGELTSPEGIAAAYWVYICSYTRISQVVNSANWTAYNGAYSPSFLVNVKGTIDKSSDQFETIGDLRTDLLGIAVSGQLSEKEATTLALMDIAVQE